MIFAARGDARDWMPDWRRNYLSWGFILAVIANVTQYCLAITMSVDGMDRRKQQQHRQLLARQRQTQPRRSTLKKGGIAVPFSHRMENEEEERPPLDIFNNEPGFLRKKEKNVRFASRFDHERKLLLKKRSSIVIPHAGHTDIWNPFISDYEH